MKHWYVRFLLRLVFYGGILYAVLRKTATHFDVTEVDAILCFLGAMIVFEGVLGLFGGVARRNGKMGRAAWPMAALVGLVVFGVAAARPSGSEVSVTYRGRASFLHLALLAEINRWP